MWTDTPKVTDGQAEAPSPLQMTQPKTKILVALRKQQPTPPATRISNGSAVIIQAIKILEIILKPSNWTQLLTNQSDDNGNFHFTSAVPPALPQNFYLLQLP
jgi:hypothetical protein